MKHYEILLLLIIFFTSFAFSQQNEMVRIKGGTFTMGSPESEVGRSSMDGPLRQVTVSSFSICKYEVTQKDYQEIMGINPSRFTGDINCPVEQVNWFDAVEYCNRKSQREGLTPAYIISGSENNRTVIWNRNNNGYRLPTEVEWEYACRAGTTTAYNTGDSITTSQARFNSSSSVAVGSYAPNDWGLYDMHGNVQEWCWDLYGDYASTAQPNPLVASSGSIRVSRGGSFGDPVSLYIRSAIRYAGNTDTRWVYLGFRIVRNAQ